MTCIFKISLSLAIHFDIIAFIVYQLQFAVLLAGPFPSEPYVIPAFYSEFMHNVDHAILQTLARFISAVSAEILNRLTSVNLSPPQRPPTVAPWEKYTRGGRRLVSFSGVY